MVNCRKPTNARLGAVHAISRSKAVTLPRRDGNRTFCIVFFRSFLEALLEG